MKNKKSNKKHYSLRYIMSFCAMIIMIIGSRGLGKTYAVKRYIIKKWIHEKEPFVWIRSTDKECEKMRENSGEKFFSDVKKEFKYLNGKIIGETFIINGSVAGYLMPMSLYHQYKGTAYEHVRNIVVDEYIPEKQQRQTGNRLVQFLNTVETIGRTRTNYKIFMMANALNKGDPLINLFGFKIKDFGIYRNKKKRCVLHYAENSKTFEKAKKESLVGLLLQDTALESNMIGNEFTSSSNMMYDKKPSNCRMICVIHYDTSSVKIWHNGVSLYAEPNQTGTKFYKGRHYTTVLDSVQSDVSMCPKNIYDSLKNHYNTSNIFFDTDYTKSIFIKFLQKRLH